MVGQVVVSVVTFWVYPAEGMRTTQNDIINVADAPHVADRLVNISRADFRPVVIDEFFCDLPSSGVEIFVLAIELAVACSIGFRCIDCPICL